MSGIDSINIVYASKVSDDRVVLKMPAKYLVEPPMVDRHLDTSMVHDGLACWYTNQFTFVLDQGLLQRSAYAGVVMVNDQDDAMRHIPAIMDSVVSSAGMVVPFIDIIYTDDDSYGVSQVSLVPGHVTTVQRCEGVLSSHRRYVTMSKADAERFEETGTVHLPGQVLHEMG